MHICVLGAGVIGVTSAYKLLQDGHQVTLLDAMPEAGSQSSFGNGAQLSYSYVAPLADPSVWTQWPHYLLGADFPLTLKPQADPAQWRWLLQFLKASNRYRARRTTIELLRLASLSRDSMAQLKVDMPLDFSHRRAGKLVMYWNAKGLQGARRQVDFQAGHGSRQEVLSLSRCIEVEPALAHAKARWVGGVYTPDEDVGDCAEFCRKLVVMMQTDLKFKFLHSVRISGLRVSDGLLRAVHGVGQVIEADRYVLALGTESIDFARMAGFSLPLYPLKGYSITVPLEAGMAGVPSVSITDLSRKIVYARLGERLRVAGRIELVGRDRSISPVAIQNLASATASLFPGLQGATKGKNSKDLSPWIGFRPATPTGMPIVDVSPVKNLFLNVGHGALGWTLACGSASILADRIAGRNPVIDAAAFDFR